jgi:hypothetical protein
MAGSNRVEAGMLGDPKECRERAKRYCALAAETIDPVLKESLVDYAERWTRIAADLEYAHDRLEQWRQKSEKLAS